MGISIDIKRIEFVVTYACSGRCKHCSVDIDEEKNECIDVDYAVDVIKKLSAEYSIESVMTFGGEPLLNAETVCKIHETARDCGIADRSVITNGFFSKDERKIEEVAQRLCESGVFVLLSVDAFHQEFIPIEPVMRFAEAFIRNDVSRLKVHPAWLVDRQFKHSYNDETERLLKMFSDKGIEVSSGNNIFPAGNALKYLREYYPCPENIDLSVPCGQMLYTSRLDEIREISINPNGDLNLCRFPIGNIYKDDVVSILNKYDPQESPVTRALMDGGAGRLLEYAENLGAAVDTSDCYSACGVCRKCIKALGE